MSICKPDFDQAFRASAPVRRCFCTMFDSGYLPRGLALYRSLSRHSPASILYVLCIDTAAYREMERLGLPNVVIIELRELEADDAALVASKANRTLAEYCFTCTPALCLYVFRRYVEPEMLTYLDA